MTAFTGYSGIYDRFLTATVGSMATIYNYRVPVTAFDGYSRLQICFWLLRLALGLLSVEEVSSTAAFESDSGIYKSI